MAKCGLCSTKKGKRYCAPIDKVICPICCAENRMLKIDCIEECRYLEGAEFQQKRLEDKEFSSLLNSVGHGQFDDIFQEPGVAFMAFQIETMVRDAYVKGTIGITDKSVYEGYKTVYAIHFQEKEIEDSRIDDLTKGLLGQYETYKSNWQANLGNEMVGQVYLRLMISVKNMSGGRMGEYGYLNYLKNNLDESLGDEEFIAEDKYGNRIKRRLE